MDVQECEKIFIKTIEKMVKSLSSFSVIIRTRNEEQWIGQQYNQY